MDTLLTIPCAYQGGKQRLSTQICEYLLDEIDDNTKIYDICCGSGAITLELINQGVKQENITMVDKSCWGAFWESIANKTFDINLFKQYISSIPSIEHIQSYLKELSLQPINTDYIYIYLLLQAGAFGGKQIWIKDNKWCNNTFRNYWLPTETSNRKSVVNPMMPMPNTLFSRVNNLVEHIDGVKAFCIDAFDIIDEINLKALSNKVIVYIDPPYKESLAYFYNLDYMKFIQSLNNSVKIFVSEGNSISNNSILLNKGRKKGNITGNVKKKPVEEWLNIFN